MKKILHGLKNDLFLNNICSLAAVICQKPISTIIEQRESKVLVKASYGLFNIKQASINQLVEQNVFGQKKLIIENDILNNKVSVKSQIATDLNEFRFYAGSPIIDEMGKVIGVLGVFDYKPNSLNEILKTSLELLTKSIIDYLELKKTKSELKKSNKENSNFFKIAPDLFCLATPGGYFKKVSQAFMNELGYTEKEILKTPFLDFVHIDDIEKTIETLKNISTKSEKTLFFRNRYRCKDGKYIWLSWNSIFDHKSGLICATARNVTDMIQLNEELNEQKNKEIKLHKEKVDMLQGLTHRISNEVLNPISIVLGFTDLCIEIINEINNKSFEEPIEEKLEHIKNDLLKIKDKGNFISDVIKRMNTDATWKEVPSVINGL